MDLNSLILLCGQAEARHRIPPELLFRLNPTERNTTTTTHSSLASDAACLSTFQSLLNLQGTEAAVGGLVSPLENLPKQPPDSSAAALLTPRPTLPGYASEVSDSLVSLIQRLAPASPLTISHPLVSLPSRQDEQGRLTFPSLSSGLVTASAPGYLSAVPQGLWGPDTMFEPAARGGHHVNDSLARGLLQESRVEVALLRDLLNRSMSLIAAQHLSSSNTEENAVLTGQRQATTTTTTTNPQDSDLLPIVAQTVGKQMDNQRIPVGKGRNMNAALPEMKVHDTSLKKSQETVGEIGYSMNARKDDGAAVAAITNRTSAERQTRSSSPGMMDESKMLNETIIDESSSDSLPADESATVCRKTKREHFPERLHRILQEIENEDLQHIISFSKTGTEVIVHDPEAFEKKIIPFYFRHGHFCSFKRQLHIYGFKRYSARANKKATDNGNRDTTTTTTRSFVFAHPMFQKGKPKLCLCMDRVNKPPARIDSKNSRTRTS